MNKIISTAMAIAMMASMTAMSSAAVAGIDTAINTVDDNNLIAPFAGETIPYGESFYLSLQDEAAAGITEYDDVRSMSIKSTWDMNGSAVARVEIVKKKAAVDSEYYYYVGVNTKDSTSTKITDVSGKITVRKSGETTIEQDVDFSLGYPVATDPYQIEDEYQIHEFDGNTEDMINFNGGYFMVNTMDQNDLLIKSSSRYNSDIAAKYPNANLDFVSFNNVSFNRIGELSLYAEEDTFLYTVNNDGTLSPIKAKYDEYEGAFKISTRTLGGFVISDSKLTIVAPDVDDSTDTDTDTDTGSKPNPPTGAIAQFILSTPNELMLFDHKKLQATFIVAWSFYLCMDISYEFVLS